MKRLFFPFALIIMISTHLHANNVQISGLVTSATNVQFNLSWDNSWFISGYNYDAVWIFVKGQNCSGSTFWEHVNLSTTPANHSVSGGTGLFVEVSSDGRGVFIRRNSAGGGTQSGAITLGFATSIPDFATFNFQVIGVEMVWVPQGDFRVGDGSNSSSQSFASFGSNSTITPFLITSEGSIGIDNLYNPFSAPGNPTFHLPIPATFPKGWAGFYCMKHEISQQQYVAFLNTLSLNQQITRTANPPTNVSGTLALTSEANQNRNSIVIQTPSTGGAPAVYNTDLNRDASYGDGANIACNYLSWADLLAYLDWAALRPMTELEFEKAARGFDSPVTTECAWGSTSSLQAISSSLTAAGTASEVSTSAGNGLCAFGAGASTTLGPLRTGFAANATTGREGAGASAWGIMDLSGNVWEQCISIGYYNSSFIRVSGGHIFTGSNGDGSVSISGNANAANWPSNSVLGNVIVRGGNWQYSLQRAQTSDRFYVSSIDENNPRVSRTGGRGVRRP